jgi:glycogen operon protein
MTLSDLVTYQVKRNEANGEENRDGAADDRGWNCGVEGPSDDPEVEALRARQVRNLLAITLISKGVPMLAMGDEARRTQRGNNNAYCHDDELTWLDWGLVERHRPLGRFVRTLLDLRFGFDPATADAERTLTEFLADARIEWHGTRLGAPDWSQESRSLAVCFTSQGQAGRIYAAFNAFWEPLDFELPPAPSGWRRLVDTVLPAPEAARAWPEGPLHADGRYRVAARSVVVLGSRG